MLKHTVIKLTKIKYKEKVLKAKKEKQQITYKGIPIRLTADILTEILQTRREWQDLLKVRTGKTKKQTYNQNYSTHQSGHSDSTEKWKALEINKCSENSAPPNQLYNKC